MKASTVATISPATSLSPSAMCRISNRPLKTTAGTDRRKENRAALGRSSPSNSPAVMVAPDRENTGNQRKRLGEADDHPVARPDLLELARVASHLVGQEQQQPEHDQRGAYQVEVARAGLDLVPEGEPEDRDRHGSDHEVPAQPRVELAPQRRLAQARQPGTRNLPELAAEVDEDRGHRAELHHCRERGAGSSQPKKAGTMRRWAVLEIGRNSVNPCVIPRTISSIRDTAGDPS